VLSFLYVTPVAAERTVDSEILSFPILPCLVPAFHQEENNRAGRDKSAGDAIAPGSLLFLPGWLVFFQHEGPGITAPFAPVYLPDAPAGYSVDIDTPADRAADHLQQLYVAYKETIGCMKKVVLSLGGSVLIPALEEHRVTRYAAVLKEIAGYARIYVVVGGGGEARRYIAAAREVGCSEAAADEVGIAITRLNALLLAGALGDAACPVVARSQAEAMAYGATGRIVLMGGVTPAQTTDAVAAVLAERCGADLMVNLTSVDGIYSADPRIDPAAVRLEKLTPENLLEIVGTGSLRAGANTVIDMIAAKVIQRSGIPLLVIDGRDPGNLARALLSGTYSGSLVSRGEKDPFPLVRPGSI
jgi:uridylate kinase